MGKGRSIGKNKAWARANARAEAETKAGANGKAQQSWSGIRLQTLTRFLNPSIRMSSAVKIRLAALRTSHALAPIAIIATCRPVTPHRA